jgi:hypothetical protein
MITTTRTVLLALLAIATLIPAPSAEASKPKALLVAPEPQFHYLPKFGFSSYNIPGIGERVTFVEWHGLAARLGLERGDTVLAVNNFPLTYHGAWRDALREALYDGGWIQLAIWDVRTGGIAYRQTFLGSPNYGPITPKSHYATHGPITPKWHGGSPKHGAPKFGSPKFTMDLSQQLEKLAKLTD